MSKDSAVAQSASTWMQVVFGGLGLSVAIVGAVIAYFAWVQPHSSTDDQPAAIGATTAVPSSSATRPVVVSKQIPLGSLEATTGGGNVHPAGRDLTMPCASGQSTDRQRTVEYDLSGHYTALTAGLTVTRAHDGDTALQVIAFLDDRQTTIQTLTKGGATRRLEIPLTDGAQLRIQLTCQLPDGEVRLDDPTLTHA